jgi:ABC-type multidrug transport system ATPase subunit
MNIIIAEDLRKSYKTYKKATRLFKREAVHVNAVDGISFTVEEGSICGLLGPNGAGKSTLIKSVCGLLRFRGDIRVGGHDNRSLEAKRLLGYVPEIPVPYPMLTVGEHLEFIARAYRLDNWQERADGLLRRFELDDKRNKLGKELSKGMQQKVSVCCALLPEPKAVIFDEPLVGLDPHGIRELKSVIAELRGKGCAVLISTHIIDTMEENWDVTFIMKNGRIVHEVRRGNQSGERLEELYFSVVEGPL